MKAQVRKVAPVIYSSRFTISTGHWRSTVTAGTALLRQVADSFNRTVARPLDFLGVFLACKKVIGRTEMRTFDKKECQSIRTVSAIS